MFCLKVSCFISIFLFIHFVQCLIYLVLISSVISLIALKSKSSSLHYELLKRILISPKGKENNRPWKIPMDGLFSKKLNSKNRNSSSLSPSYLSTPLSFSRPHTLNMLDQQWRKEDLKPFLRRNEESNHRLFSSGIVHNIRHKVIDINVCLYFSSCFVIHNRIYVTCSFVYCHGGSECF